MKLYKAALIGDEGHHWSPTFSGAVESARYWTCNGHQVAIEEHVIYGAPTREKVCDMMNNCGNLNYHRVRDVAVVKPVRKSLTHPPRGSYDWHSYFTKQRCYRIREGMTIDDLVS